MIVVISEIRVISGNSDELAELYRHRLGLADGAPGCLGVEILRSESDPNEFVVYTRWKSHSAYYVYRASRSYREAHARLREIQGGIRIDPVDRSVRIFEVLS